MNINQVYNIPLKDIVLLGINVRTDLTSPNSEEGIKELAESIKTHGLMQPIVLRGEFGKPTYDVVVGQRRFLAHQYLKLNEIQATFTGNIGDIDALLLSLSENLLRVDLNEMDKIVAITKLYIHFGRDVRKVKERLGLSIRKIREYIKIEELASSKIKALLRSGSIRAVDARRIINASQGDQNKADELVEELPKLTPFEKRRLEESGKNKPNATAEELLKDAKTPIVKETIVLDLPMRVAKSLKKASESLNIDSEAIALNALINWLKINDFYVEHN